MNFILLKNLNIIWSIVSKYIYHVFLFHVLNTFTFTYCFEILFLYSTTYIQLMLQKSFRSMHEKCFSFCYAFILCIFVYLTIHYITFTYKYVNTRLEMIFLMSLYVSKYYYYILLIMKHEGKKLKCCNLIFKIILYLEN